MIRNIKNLMQTVINEIKFNLANSITTMFNVVKDRLSKDCLGKRLLANTKTTLGLIQKRDILPIIVLMCGILYLTLIIYLSILDITSNFIL